MVKKFCKESKKQCNKSTITQRKRKTKATQVKTNKKEVASNKHFKEYYKKNLINTFEQNCPYIYSILHEKEEKIEKRAILTEEILRKFSLDKELRRNLLKYIFDMLTKNNIPRKYYFKTMSVFDSFLINFSEQNTEEECKQLFISKHTKTFSETKLVVLCFCCFYLVNQIWNSHSFDLKCLINWNEKNEYSFDELCDLVDLILITLDCDTNKINIYDFLEIFLFDINNRIKDNINEEFKTIFNDSIFLFAIKFTQDIKFLSIPPRTQAISIIAVGFSWIKLDSKNSKLKEVYEYIEQWLCRLKEDAKCENTDIANIVNWCDEYVKAHF